MNIRNIGVTAVLLLAMAAAPGLSAQDAPAQTVRLKVTAEQANLRERPDIGSVVVQQIPQGTVLEADRKEGEWYLVRYTLEDGGVIAGYIHESLVAVLGTAPASAGQPGAETKPEPRTKSARPDERAGSWYEVFLPVDVFVAAGGSTVIADDFNKAGRGLADLNGAALGAASSGSIGSLSLTYLFSLEVSYRLSRWISIGLGTEYLRGWRTSQITYAGGAVPSGAVAQTTVHPFVEAVPVKIGLRFYPRPDFYIRTSAVYYFVTAGYDDRFASSATDWQQWNGKATAQTVGLEVTAGGEWRLASNVFFFAEAGFRLTPAFGLAGAGTYADSTGAKTSESGPLWFYQQLGADGHGHDLLFIQTAQPSGTDILGVRQASVNLTGTTARMGVKVRF